MNTDPQSVHALLYEHNGGNPIVIDEGILSDYDSKVKLQPCQWNGCTMHQHHGINTSAMSEETQKISCLWMGCSDAQTRPGNIARHVLSMHLGVRWICLTCGKHYTRKYAFRRHTQEKLTCQYARSFLSYGDRA
ncbi:hypothetical protein K503DRAFT_765683 [Rhizopogon vinicolor AM-OR11-026]|uniref:C2H2-type domain-containing protein n=1 Tax=Rhizopogon vinicolor AM-OR11-026 TaxID=1314800 RepID=A0A1B7NG07_9AGAM|nr:hypothetical protein K503DRAFT_765683 [Rhizopogon vinicolor AM-OR11-026]